MNNKVYASCIMLFMLIFLVGNVSALEIDNVKSYDEDKREYLIENAFGLGEDIARVKLNSELVELLIVGYQKVAEFNIENYEDYINVFNEMEFFDLKDDGKKFTRDFNYKQKTIIQVPNIENVCNDYLSANGTLHKDCNLIEKGTKDKIIWEEINKVDGLLKGNITIGIFTEVRRGDKVEWVPTLFGERLTKWAVWEDGGLKVGLVSFYRLDNIYSNNTVIDALENNTGNNSGASRGVSGIINKSFGYDGTRRNQTNITTNFGFGVLNNTVNLWINPANLSQRGIFVNIGSHDSTFNGFGVGIGDSTADNVGDNLIGIFGGVGWFDPDIVISPGWSMVTMVMNGTKDMHFYLNGTSVGNSTGISAIAPESNTTIGGTPGGTNRYFDGRIDEISFWNRTLTGIEIIELYNFGLGCTYEDETCGLNLPITTLNSPVNNFNTNNQTIDFNGTVVSPDGITTVALFIDGILNETNSSGINDTNYLFSRVISEGSHNWSYQSCNTNGCRNSTTRDFEIDISGPILNITFPLNITYLVNLTNSTTRSIQLNYTVTDPFLDTCRALNITSGNNITLASCVNTTFTVVYGQYTFRVFANDTFGQNATDSEVATFDYKILENNFTFANSTLEGSTEKFIYDLNVSAGLTITAVNLIYNGTIFTTSLQTSGDHVISERDLIIPSVSVKTNITFNWNITLSDGFTYNSSSHNQTVDVLSLDNCSTFTNLIYNYSIVDEELQTSLSNTNVELNIDLFDISRSKEILNFSKVYVENPVLVCIAGSILASTKYSADSIIKYQAVGYEIEYYNIINFTLSNSSGIQNITLYDLNSTDSTEFQITFKDSNFLSVPGALIFIQRQYIAENNTFKTVELPKTDSNGQTLGHFVEKDIVYNILVTNGTTGRVLGSFNNIIAFCEDETIGDCTINLNAVTSSKEGFDYRDDIKLGLSNPRYNGTSRILSLDFFTFDGSSKEINLTAFKYDQLGDSVACSSILISSSGSISCTVPQSFGNSSMRVFLYVDGDLIFQDLIIIDTNQDFGTPGYLILFLMILMLVMMFSESKTGMIIAVFVGLIAGVSFSLFTGKIMGLASSIIWLIVAGSILIWKLNKENN